MLAVKNYHYQSPLLRSALDGVLLACILQLSRFAIERPFYS